MKKFTLCAVLVIALAITAERVFSAGTGPGVTAETALKLLVDGNQRFATGTSQHNHQDEARRIDTATNGQHPFATVITCSDSRVPVEITLDQGIGDIFVVRVAGNVVDTDEAGSIEYGVDHLATPLFVVLGHTNCGACTAVVDGAALHGNIPALVDNIIPAKDKTIAKHPHLTGNELVAEVIKENVWQSIEDLYTISPISADLVRANKLKVVGAIYNLKTGLIEWLGEHPNQKDLLYSTVDPYDPLKIYNQGDKCTHNNKTWIAGWWTKGQEPGTTGEYGVWQEVK